MQEFGTKLRALSWAAASGLCVAALALAVPLAPVQAQTTGIAVGVMAPTARVITLEGAPVALDSLVGDMPVMIEFFATWCPLCRKLEPQMKALQAQYGGRARFITITVRDNQSPQRVMDYVAKNKLGGTFLFDRDGEAVKSFQVPHTSYILVLDRKGTVVYTGVGAGQDLAAAMAMAFRP